MGPRRFLNSKLPTIWHGGDYCPEQWTPEVWDEDMRLMQKTRFMVATMGMFAWARMEPKEGEFDFDWLDEVIARLERAGRYFILGTPSAAPPAWLSKKYPDTLRTGPDGVRRGHGNRVNFNWSSPVYQEKTRQIATQLAKRYGTHPNLLAWHLSNEYGGEDYSDESLRLFRLWLFDKFNGDLDALNSAYWTAFWGHTFSDWDEIDLPGEPYGETAIQGLTVDWMRFNTEQAIRFMEIEAGPLRELSPNVPITTNLMGTYTGLDYRKLARHLDFVSWDSYPAPTAEHDAAQTWVVTGFKHDLMRSLKPDAPWLLMEYTPNTANWYEYMTLKRPGMHRFESFHALAHGADGLQYFQWRQSRGGQEQFHGAVVGHGSSEATRTFGDVRELGFEIERIEDLAGTAIEADVALVFDWENRWALEAASGPVRGDRRYEETCIQHYQSLISNGFQVDIVGMDDDISRYRFVLAPMAYSLRETFVDRIIPFVEQGGFFLTTYLSGWVDANSLVFEEGFLAPLRKLLGIRSEELDALRPGRGNRLEAVAGNRLGLSGVHDLGDFCELIHTQTAQVCAVYRDEFYAGSPAITEHQYGAGRAIYVGARGGQGLLDQILPTLAHQSGARRVLEEPLPAGVTAHLRTAGDRQFLFLLNASKERVHVASERWGSVDLNSFDAALLTGAPARAGEAR